MEFVEFVEKVENRIQNPGKGEAERAVISTFEVLGECVSGGEASDIAADLPGELTEPLRQSSGNARSLSLDNFFRRVSEREGSGINLASDHATAVMSVLGEAMSEEERQDLRSQLSRDFYPLLQPQES